MNDYLLVFPDESTSTTVLTDSGVVHNPAGGINIDSIGLVYTLTATGENDADGLPVYGTTAVAGWHVNIRSAETLRLPDEYIVQPENRIRFWQ